MSEVYEVVFDLETGEETKIYLSEEEIIKKKKKSASLLLEENAQAAAKAALLERLGITEEEAKLLLG